MKSIFFSILILFPALVWSQSCPTFQSVIPLRESATSSNFSYAIVADGKYYLTEAHDFNRKNLKPNGFMPKGFEKSRLITVVDRSHCNDSQYYLIAIKSIRPLNADSLQTSYSTLDLMNWDLMNGWSQPKPLSEHPLFANDPYFKVFNEFGADSDIEELVQTIFYWEQTQTHFVVTKPLIRRYPSEPIKSAALRYYMVDAQNTCNHSYSYSQRPEILSLALNTVVEPLDLCFFSHFTGLSDPLLYCLGGTSFQVNSIDAEYKNGSIRTTSLGTPEHLPTIDRLRVIGSLRPIQKVPEVEPSSGVKWSETKDRIRVRISPIKIGVLEDSDDQKSGSKIGHKPNVDSPAHPPNEDYWHPMRTEAKAVVSTEKTEEDSSSTFIIVLICLAIFVLIMIGILIIAARRQQQIAKM